jgi:hypothetical protein
MPRRRSFGRLYGEIANSFLVDPFEPGVYAVVACSAMIAGATHTISPCIVMIEITAQANNIMPLLVCTIVAYSVSGMFTISLYDMMLDINNLPFLPRVRSSGVYKLRARDVMHTDFPFLSLNTTNRDAIALLCLKKPEWEDSSSIAQFPLVDSPQSMMLLGAVARDDLERVVCKDPR